MSNHQFSLASTIDWVTYKSYEHNRLRNPHVPYYKWRKIFNDAMLFEKIFDQNLTIINTKGAWGHAK